MEEDIKDKIQIQPEEQEIDLVELAKKLWKAKRLIIKVGVIGAIVGIIVAFSIPREYTTTIKLSPEMSGSKSMSGSLGALASMAGINMGGGSSADAVYPTLYPDVVESVPFIVDLFNVPVEDSKGEIHTTLYEYIKEYNSAPWWSTVIGLPFKAIGAVRGLFADPEEEADSAGIDPFRLSQEADAIRKALSNRINVDVDTKTSVVSVSVMMQDPLISANVADTVAEYLRTYVTSYRTNKANKDLEYAEKLNKEAEEAYLEAQKAYAEYVDKNQGIAFNSGRIEEARLQNEAQLKYDLYNTTAQQVQMAKAKVQENTPVYAVVQPATVPLKPTKPSKVMILIAFTFLAVVGASAWVLFGRDFIAQFKEDKE